MFALLVLWRRVCTFREKKVSFVFPIQVKVCLGLSSRRFGISVPLVFLGAFFGYKKARLVRLATLEQARCAARHPSHFQFVPIKSLDKFQRSHGTLLETDAQQFRATGSR